MGGPLGAPLRGAGIYPRPTLTVGKRTFLSAAFLLAGTVAVPAQEPAEREVLFCDADHPANRLEVLNDWRVSRPPRTPNRAVSSGHVRAVSIERGSALERLVARDFLHVEIHETGFVVEYIVDLALWPPRGVILPTTGGATCPTNEILRVATALAPPEFRRGDVDASGDAHMTDAIRIIDALFFEQETPIPCLAALDVDDDGLVNLTDPIRILRYLYQGDEAPPEPFQSCGQDSTPGEPLLDCVESGCR